VVIPAVLAPVTTPALLIVAMLVFALVQVPPVGEQLNVTVAPWHTRVGPVIAVGKGVTVTGDVVRQPVKGNVYVIVATAGNNEPVTVPDTTPLDDTPAAALLLLHDPPEGVEPNAVVDPWHTTSDPVIGVGSALTVIVLDIPQPEPPDAM